MRSRLRGRRDVPHLARIGSRWYCVHGHSVGMGSTQAQAYGSWKDVAGRREQSRWQWREIQRLHEGRE